MDPDPMQYVEEDDDEKVKEKVEAKNTRKLNTLVAISVALLATFMGICKTKDDNIVQAMQQAQADKIDNYSWYQARNIREEIAKATIAELTAQSAAAPQQAQQSFQDKIKEYQAIEQDQLWFLNLCDLKGWNSPMAKQLNVVQIPYSIIIDNKSRIIAFNLKREKLINFVNALP